MKRRPPCWRLLGSCELDVLKSAYVEPGAAGGADEARSRLSAGGTAQDQAGGVAEDAALGEGAGVAASGAASGSRSDVDAEDVAEGPADAVAVGPCLGHGMPPLGPNRSVLICRSPMPWSTSRRAALSTNPVGPQMKHCWPADGGPARCRSCPASRRPTGPGHPAGAWRV